MDYILTNNLGKITVYDNFSSAGNMIMDKDLNNNDLVVTGKMLDYDYPIEIPLSWFLIGYLHQEPYPINEMVSAIVNNDNLLIIKDYLGNIYRKMGEYEIALKTLQKSENIKREINEKIGCRKKVNAGDIITNSNNAI